MGRIYLIAIIFKIIAAKYSNTTTTKKKNNVKYHDLKGVIDIAFEFPCVYHQTRLSRRPDLFAIFDKCI